MCVENIFFICGWVDDVTENSAHKTKLVCSWLKSFNTTHTWMCATSKTFISIKFLHACKSSPFSPSPASSPRAETWTLIVVVVVSGHLEVLKNPVSQWKTSAVAVVWHKRIKMSKHTDWKVIIHNNESKCLGWWTFLNVECQVMT